jgi:transcription elongation factor GreA
MTDQVNYITQKGYNKHKKRLEFLITEKRRKISKALEFAISLGDLGENAEYKAAGEEQALNEIRIAELSKKLSSVRIINSKEIVTGGNIRFGSTVKIRDIKSGEAFDYTLVSEIEADIDEDLISVESPVGKGLLGRKENDIVQLKVPGGIMKFKILKVS